MRIIDKDILEARDKVTILEAETEYCSRLESLRGSRRHHRQVRSCKAIS